MQNYDFKKLIEGAVGAALATTTLTIVGCGDDIDLSGFDPAPCNKGVKDLNPQTEVDYVKLMTRSFDIDEYESGTPCATASEPQTCEEALEAAGGNADLFRTRIVTTSGDTVSSYESREEILEFLGPIDTEGEAVLLAWASGYTIGCSNVERGAVKAVGGGFEVIGTRMVQSCAPVETRQYRLGIDRDGTIRVLDDVQLEYDSNVCVGRRPDGFQRSDCDLSDACASFWSTTAHLEASAVDAFEALAWELERFGAPAELVERALRAAREEQEHTVDTRRLAEEFGGTFVEPETTERRERSLVDFAIENMTEGCVRETFGAVVGTFQARAATRASVAEVMSKISAEETGHAELSWDIATWLNSRLTDAERRQVDAARDAAVRALLAEMRVPIPLELVVEAGLPTPDQAMAMFEVMRRDLWQRAA